MVVFSLNQPAKCPINGVDLTDWPKVNAGHVAQMKLLSSDRRVSFIPSYYERGMDMKTIKDILKNRSSEIWSISPMTTAYEALKVMAEKDIGALLVFENEELVGIFSERDYARKVVLKGKTSKDTPVRDLMTLQVFYVKPENTLNECMALMTVKNIRHLPVVDNNRVTGILTIRDVVKEIVSDLYGASLETNIPTEICYRLTKYLPPR